MSVKSSRVGSIEPLVGEITLRDIWDSSDVEVEKLVRAGGQEPGTPMWNRTFLAVSYYNSGQLAASDAEIVGRSGFTQTMTNATDLKQGLLRVTMEPIARKLLEITEFITAARILLIDGATGVLQAVNEQAWAINDASEVYIGQDALSVASEIFGKIVGGDLEEAITEAADDAVRDAMRIFLPSVMASIRASVDPAVLIDNILRGVNDVFLTLVAREAWRETIRQELRIRGAVEGVQLTPLDSASVAPLFEADLSAMDPQGRCYHLLLLREILELISSIPAALRDEWPILREEWQMLRGAWQTSVAQYGMNVFNEIPVTFGGELLPVLGAIAPRGGQTALSTLIEEYGSRSPTHDEVVARILALL